MIGLAFRKVVGVTAGGVCVCVGGGEGGSLNLSYAVPNGGEGEKKGSTPPLRIKERDTEVPDR